MHLNLPDRHRPAHGVWPTFDGPTVVLVTSCTRSRQHVLNSAGSHAALRAAWAEADAWKVGRYVVMPDHVHLFPCPSDHSVSLERWVKFWKARFTMASGLKKPRQPGHWDTRMRSEGHFESKWDYVLQNPVRHGYVKDAGDWPYRGEMTRFRW